VFVVAHLGKGNLAAKVLFESESVRRNPAPSRETRQGVATNVAPSLTASNDPSRSPQSSEVTQQVNAVLEAVAESHWNNPSAPSDTLLARDYKGIGNQDLTSGRLLVPAIPIHDQALYENHPNDSRVTDTQNMTEGHASGGKGHGNDGDPSFTLTKGHSHAVAVDIYNQAVGVKSQTLRSGASSIEHSGGVINPADRMAVRRLTPRECERLQGFPDDHTLIPWRNKPADQCPDGPRYKALGNSMAVPCMAWIGERIEWIENERQGVV
jgi:DNA (cytosine-5)-methyltransferase 1